MVGEGNSVDNFGRVDRTDGRSGYGVEAVLDSDGVFFGSVPSFVVFRRRDLLFVCTYLGTIGVCGQSCIRRAYCSY